MPTDPITLLIYVLIVIVVIVVLVYLVTHLLLIGGIQLIMHENAAALTTPLQHQLLALSQ
jgi:hypothetical protein